ncbi:hypothetical protein [Ornithinimicrobium cerasi]|uniref:hypothetical protein n=1 Tax=Ornithinimicrobium cerasi TaxID=2248773 RepID=UPI000EFFDB06|nr:hypothetical protein [Ornithinimicrobium cerasi]
MKVRAALSSLAVVAAVTAVGAAAPASAGHDRNPSERVATYAYGLAPVQAESVPNSQAGGSTRITALPNGKVQVSVQAWGLAPLLPHAMHLHGFTDQADLGCPGPAADSDGNGLVNVIEGAPSYGGIIASLTTSGDTSPSSALALDRFPVADADGRLSYTRTFVNGDSLANADTAQVVVHGIDLNTSGTYDFDAGPSELTDQAPLEATLPVLCGGIAN